MRNHVRELQTRGSNLQSPELALVPQAPNINAKSVRKFTTLPTWYPCYIQDTPDHLTLYPLFTSFLASHAIDSAEALVVLIWCQIIQQRNTGQSYK